MPSTKVQTYQHNAKKNESRTGKPRYPKNRIKNDQNVRSERKSPPRTELKCYRCDRIGHLSKDCFSKTKKDGSPIKGDPPRSKNSSSKVNLVSEAKPPIKNPSVAEILCIKHAKGVQENKWGTTSTSHTNLVVGGGKLLEKEVICNRERVIAVVDTVAYVSVVDERVAKHYGWEIQHPVQRLVGADGESLKSKGMVTLNFELRLGKTSKAKIHQFAVVENLTAQLLLGLELMRELNILIDTSSGVLTYATSKVKTGIRTLRDEVIPKRSQSILKARVNTVGTILQVPFTLENGLCIAKAVSDCKNNITEVMILNPSDEPTKIKQGTQLASYEPMETDEKRVGSSINTVLSPKGSAEVVNVGSQLTAEQIEQLSTVLQANKNAFSLNGEIGVTDVHYHEIELLPNAEPFAEPLRRRALVQIEETRKQVNKMLDEGIIEESDSPWASAYVLARKKNGEYRLCIDFRKLNLMTKKTVYPLPNIEECLETLSGKTYFSQLDFASGFWQIPMHENSREMTAFRTEDGLFQFKRMPFGLTNAPASFQKTINKILAGLKGMNLQVFIDDVCIATDNWPEHLKMLAKVFKAIIDSNMKIKPDKCLFGAEKITFLGHEISKEGIRRDPSKLKALTMMPYPNDTHGIKRALGMFSYYRKFVKNFALIAEPLTKLTRKGVDFQWEAEQKQAYDEIICQLKKNATLAHFNHIDPLLVKTDASKKGVAGILLQRQNDEWKIITCCSRRLTSSETNYGITDLEGLAVVYTVTKLRPYLLGKKFQILVDHCALCVLNKRMPNSARLRRWAIVLSEYDFEIIYTKGELHQDIDCLSRAPVDDATDSLLERSVYTVTTPMDTADWISSYSDSQSRELFQKAYDREDKLRLINDIIYYEDLLYVPMNKRDELIRLTHNSNMNDHPGTEATTAKLKENYWWPKMHEDVRRVVSVCPKCAMEKAERARPAGEMRSFDIFEPSVQVAIDCLGPITESLDGNIHIIVAIDTFTRFMDAKAVPDITAPTFNLFLIEYCSRYGVPNTILTDQSTTFCNAMTSEILKVFGASHVKATPHHSQSNAIVERSIQTLQEKLRLVLEDPIQETNWDTVLPIAILAINTTYHKSIGYTPFEMTFGRRPPLQDKNVTRKVTPHDLHTKLIQIYMKECHATAVAIQSTSQEKSRKYYEGKHRPKLFSLNDRVVIRAPDRRSKLSSKYLGPYKIVGKTNDVYKLEDEKTGKILTRHVMDLKGYPQRPTNNSVALIRPLSWIQLTLLTTILVLVGMIPSSTESSVLFSKISPVVWFKTPHYVSQGLAEYDINFGYVSPCDLYEKTIRRDPVLKSNISEDQARNLAFFAQQCTNLFQIEWEEAVTEFINSKSINFNPQFTKNTDVPNGKVSNILLRRKKGIVADIAGEAIKQAIGAFTGIIISNLINAVIERVNTYSNTNRIGRLETAMKEIEQNFDIQKEFNRGVLDQMSDLSNMVENVYKRTIEFRNDFPQYVWITSLITNKIGTSGLQMKEIIQESKKGRMATSALGKLTNLKFLLNVPVEHTRFQSVTRIKENAFNIKFVANIEDPDTKVYKAFGFNHWDNLDDTPRLLRYNGAHLLIYNESTNCIKALLDEPVSDVIGEKCDELDGTDPALNQWEVEASTLDIENYVNRSQVKKSTTFNFIYCFPGNITIEGKNYRCPIDPFKLDARKAFKTANYRHSAIGIRLNATLKEIAIDNVHPGQFREDSDVRNQLALFDSLREQRRRLANLTETMELSFSVSKGSPWLWMFITTYISSVGFAVAYCATVYWCKSRPSPVPTTPRTEIPLGRVLPAESNPFLAQESRVLGL